MIGLLLLAASAATPAPAAAAGNQPILAEAAHAIDSGRLEEARLIIARAIGSGVSGRKVDRLLADLAFASGRYEDALSQYQALVAADNNEPDICEKGAIAALNLGRLTAAAPLAECAVTAPHASWRAWNARGVVADLSQEWALAGDCFEKAHDLAPDRAEVINNRGWSLLLQGSWDRALPYFEEASRIDPKSRRIANNLDLARAAVAADLPARRTGEAAPDWAARLNDAGVAARLLGDNKRALAAFTQALYANDQWYARAANNLESASTP